MSRHSAEWDWQLPQINHVVRDTDGTYHVVWNARDSMTMQITRSEYHYLKKALKRRLEEGK